MEDATITGMEEKRKELDMTVAEFYAIPRNPPSDSKLPIFDAAHVRAAMARFDQVTGVSTEEKASAKKKIVAAAHKYKIDTSTFDPTGSKNLSDAVLKIYGDIGEGGITSAFVSDFLDKSAAAENITVRINSRGGDVSEGWAIHDLLVNSGKKITTIGESQVYSIATIIFLAGSEREMMANADGEIHNPYIPPFTLADSYESSDLLKLAEGLAQEEDKILNFYVDRTGADKSKLADYMSADTKLSAEDMLRLGFATKIVEPVKAYAYVNFKNSYIMNEKEVKTFGEKLDTIISKIAGFSRLPVFDKGQVITDKDGKAITLVKDTGAPAVGDQATPDGIFTMASGQVITVAGGVITTIDTTAVAEEVTPSSYQKLKTENEKLKQDLVDLTAKVTLADTVKAEAETVKAEAETIKTEFEAEKVKAVALVTELQGLKNAWKPEGRTRFSSAEKVGDIDLNQVREIKKKLNEKSE